MSTTTRSSNASSSPRRHGGGGVGKPARKRPQPDTHRGARTPQSLDSVHDKAASVIGSLNTRVEALHDKHRWEELLAKPQIQQLHACLTETPLEGRHRSFSDFNALFNPAGLPSELRPLYDQLGALFDEFHAKAVKSTIARLTDSLLNGLVRYCLPLGELCTTEIDIVRQYEKTHARLDGELNKDLADLFAAIVQIEKLRFPKFLKHPEQSNDLLKKVRAAINKMYYIVNEWVDCDRTYIDDISEKLQEGKQRLEEIDSEAEKARASLQDERQMKKLQDEVEKLEERVKQLRTKQSKCTTSQQSNTARLGLLDAELQEKTRRRGKLEEQRVKLEEQRKASQAASRSRSQQDLEWAILQEREAAQEQEKLRDTIASVQRYQKHLEASRGANETDLRSANDRLAKLKSNQEATRRRHDQAQEQLARLQTERELLDPQVADLRVLSEKKASSASLRELHASGHIISPRKVKKPIAAACSDVAQRIGPEWRDLYAHLPMDPDRTKSTRRRDVEKLDLIGGRQDLPEPELAAKSLERWRLMNPQSRPEGLMVALRKIEKDDLAQQVEHKFKYKKG